MLNQEQSLIIEIKEEFSEHILVPFLRWTKTEVFVPKKITTKMKIAGTVGFGIGAVGMYHTGVLGGRFGDVIAKQLNIENPHVVRAMYYFFAIDAILSMIALSGMATKAHFQQAASNKSLYAGQITKENRKWLRKGLIATAYLLGAFAAITPAYVTGQVLKDSSLWLKILMSVPAYIGGFMFKVEAEKALLNKSFNALSQGETEFIRQRRRILIKKTEQIIKLIRSISDEELIQTFKMVFEKTVQTENVENNSPEEHELNKMKLLYAKVEHKPIVSVPRCSFW